MANPISLDLRIRVLAAIADGASQREAAERFGVSAASVSRWRTLARHQGNPRPSPMGGDRRSARSKAQTGKILEMLNAKPDITVRELRDELSKSGHSFGVSTIYRVLIRQGMKRKKRLHMLASRTAPKS